MSVNVCVCVHAHMVLFVVGWGFPRCWEGKFHLLDGKWLQSEVSPFPESSMGAQVQVVGVILRLGLPTKLSADKSCLLVLLARVWLFGFGCCFLDTGGTEAMLTPGWSGHDSPL